MTCRRRWWSLVVLAGALACNTTLPFGATAIPTETPVPSATPIPPTLTVIPAAYIPPQCEGTPPATIPPATTAAEPTASLTGNPTLTTQEQLRVFDQLTAKINAVYVYPDFNGLDWPGMVAESRARVEAGLDTEAFYDEMRNLVTQLGDEHSYFESPLEVAESEAALAGKLDYVGIGVFVQPLLDRDRIVILSVFSDSPAERAGLKPHDSLLAVDGLPLIEAELVYHQRLRGPECSALVLTVQSPGEEPRDVTIVRARIVTSLPIAAQLVPTSDGSRIGYIFVPTFFDETIAGQVRQALDDFGPLDGLIIDNRMNGGGSSSVLEPTLSYFTSGTLGHFVSRTSRRPLTIDADPVHNSQEVPLVVLVSENTVSYGEVFAAVLQDSGRAKLVGETTLGNVETLHGYTFEDGSQVWIAEESFDSANSDADWELQGIIPDVEASAAWDTFTFENDPGVAAALKLLGH